MLFTDMPAYLIGVHCPRHVVEQRERDRADRTLGQAAKQIDYAHVHGVYDFEVNTASSSAEACAAAIKAFIESDAPPTAFRQISSRKIR